MQFEVCRAASAARPLHLTATFTSMRTPARRARIHEPSTPSESYILSEAVFHGSTPLEKRISSVKALNLVRQASAALLAAALLAPAAVADEGMWTFDNPPLKQLQEKYNFIPNQQWLDHLRLSCVRLNDGGSGSFVSPHGLLLTNHHVALGQLQKNSTAEHDYVRDGFYAATPDQEMKSPDLEVNVLVSMENVSDKVNVSIKDAKTAEEEFTKRKAAITGLERESTEKTGLRSDVVTLYA